MYHERHEEDKIMQTPGDVPFRIIFLCHFPLEFPGGTERPNLANFSDVIKYFDHFPRKMKRKFERINDS